MSHPSRVRGLKFAVDSEFSIGSFLSHPSRVRGLKYAESYAGGELKHVAPFTGAWIEMLTPELAYHLGRGRTLHGCVD